jgi:REP element-mobilizing transposase RayT
VKQGEEIEKCEVEILTVENEQNDVHQLLKLIMPLSVDEFFQKFYSEKALFSVANLF